MNKPLLTALLAACAAVFSIAPSYAQSSPEQLTKAEVEQIIAQAATQAMRTNPGAIIAVTDREGFVLGVWDVQRRIPNPLPPFVLDSPATLRIYGLVAGAITRAGTAAFLSSDQEALTTRTAGYITQQHFPPGVSNTPPGPLVGVGFSNLFFRTSTGLSKSRIRWCLGIPSTRRIFVHHLSSAIRSASLPASVAIPSCPAR